MEAYARVDDVVGIAGPICTQPGVREVVGIGRGAVVVREELAMKRQSVLRPESNIIAGGILHGLRLSSQELGKLGVQTGAVVESIQAKSRDLITRAHIEQPRAGVRLLAGAVDRAAAVALRISNCQCGQVR